MRKKSLILGACSLALVACGGGNEAGNEVTGETVIESTEPTANEVAEVASETPMQSIVAASGDPIRGPGGMEERCLDRVNETVGGGVIGTNRIEEAESGVMIYVNVQGASAPWQCFGSRDGTISEVYFGGDEGAL